MASWIVFAPKGRALAARSLVLVLSACSAFRWLLDLKEGLTLTGREQEKIAEVMDHFEKTKRDAKFDWIWYGRLDRLLRYKREYHTFTVSKSDNKHKKLRAWVIRQREMEKENKLAEQRKKMLMNVGFDFSHRFASRKRKYTYEQENA